MTIYNANIRKCETKLSNAATLLTRKSLEINISGMAVGSQDYRAKTCVHSEEHTNAHCTFKDLHGIKK